jgi:hypothetical protein
MAVGVVGPPADRALEVRDLQQDHRRVAGPWRDWGPGGLGAGGGVHGAGGGGRTGALSTRRPPGLPLRRRGGGPGLGRGAGAGATGAAAWEPGPVPGGGEPSRAKNPAATSTRSTATVCGS